MNLETKPDTKERRTTGVQRQGRAARVLNAILDASCEELSETGYAALRIEDVAARAGVNKTTIYRRWPTKVELVTDAIKSHLQEQSTASLPDTGSLREDLLVYFQTMLASLEQPLYRGILLALNSHLDPTLDELGRELRTKNRRIRAGLVERGIERGELPRKVDAELVANLISSPILLSALHHGEPVTASYIESIVDTVLAGTAANAFRANLN